MQSSATATSLLPAVSRSVAMQSRVFVGLVVLTIAAAACGGDDGASTATTGSVPASENGDTIGPDGGSITSEDGMFIVEVPAGALSTELELGVTLVSPSDAGLDPSLLAGHVYELNPDGTVFERPVITTRILSAAALGVEGDDLPFFHVFQGSGDEWDALSTETSREDDVIRVRAAVEHFSSNAAVASANVWAPGREVTLEVRPGSFSAPVGSSVFVGWLFDVPDILISREVVALSSSGAIVAFDNESPFDGIAVCGGPGDGTYTVTIDGTLEDEAGLPPIPFVRLSPRQEPFTISATGNATCTEPEPADNTDQSAASFLAGGAFGGGLEYNPVLAGTPFSSPILLSVLSPESAEAVLSEEARSIRERIMQLAGELHENAAADSTIVLSQSGPDDVAQNTYGAAFDVGDGVVRIYTVDLEETYSEFYILDVTLCDGFPNACQDVTVEGVSAGGSPDLTLEDSFPQLLELQPGATEDYYDWHFVVSGTLTREG